MIKFFIEPLLMIVGIGIIVGLMYTGSVLYEKHKREDKE
jgi:hypothetical protein